MSILKPKNKKEKQIQTFIMIALSILIVWFIWKKIIKPRKDAKAAEEAAAQAAATGVLPNAAATAPSAPTYQTSAGGNKIVGNNTTLKYGMYGIAEVAYLQSYYNEKIAKPKGYTKLAVDGDFGNNTLKVVKNMTGQSSTTWAAWKERIDKVVAGQAQANAQEAVDYVTLDLLSFGLLPGGI